MAGVDAPSHMDGRSVLPLFLNNRRRQKWPDTFLIERYKPIVFTLTRLFKKIFSFSSGRRDTPETKKLNKYTAAANEFGFSTSAPDVSTAENQYLSRLNTAATAYTSTLASPKYFESAEDLSEPDLFPDDENDDDLEDADENTEDEIEEVNDDFEDFDRNSIKSKV